MAKCMSLFTVIDKDTHQSFGVPCGKCPACYARRTSGWSFRLMQQDKISLESHFVTLTYDTPFVHLTDNGFLNLNKRDCQLFIKRLRKLHADSEAYPVRYYLVGEYGGKSLRPHYHAILFNARQADISKAWGLGNIHFGKVEGASIGYTLKYMSKPSMIPLHKNDDRIPEFALMSKGLGKNYITPQMQQWHENDNTRMYCLLEGGKKISMPRYYKDRIYTKEDRQRVGDAVSRAMLIEQDKKVQEYLEKGQSYFYEQYLSNKMLTERMHKNSSKNEKL